MNERWQCKHSDVYLKTDPPISVSTHSSQTLPQVLASESFFNSQEENTKFYFLYQGPPNTQRVNSKCNLSSISHISLKSIITEALTRKSFLCNFDIKCHLWTWRTRTIVQALAHSLSPSLSPSDCQTHRENSLLLWRFQYFQNCSTDAAEVLYQEFWSVWLFTSPHKPCVIRATLQAQAFYHLSKKQLENFFTKFQYIQDDEILLKPRQQHSQHIQNHKELWWKVTLSPSCMLKFPATGFLVEINPA